MFAMQRCGRGSWRGAGPLLRTVLQNTTAPKDGTLRWETLRASSSRDGSKGNTERLQSIKALETRGQSGGAFSQQLLPAGQRTLPLTSPLSYPRNEDPKALVLRSLACLPAPVPEQNIKGDKKACASQDHARKRRYARDGDQANLRNQFHWLASFWICKGTCGGAKQRPSAAALRDRCDQQVAAPTFLSLPQLSAATFSTRT